MFAQSMIFLLLKILRANSANISSGIFSSVIYSLTQLCFLLQSLQVQAYISYCIFWYLNSFGNVLVLVGIELIVFLATGTVLWFGFTMRRVLIIH